MGLIQKKDEKEEIDGIQIIERGEGPDGDDEDKVDLVAGTSAEHIARGTTAEAEDEKAARAMAADAADENLMPEDDDEDGDDEGAGSKKKLLIIAGVVIAVVLAAVIGYFVGNGGFGGKGTGASELTADQLDEAVASYTYNGAKHDITAREAIESQYSIDSVKTDDDKYTAPSADTILSYVRNQILLSDAESQGITVSAKEMKKYAKDTIGTSSYKSMAKQYGVTKSQAKEIVKQSCILQKLYSKVVPSTSSMPEAPSEPADQNNQTDEEKKSYADYIIKLAGDEWDSSKGTWKSSKGTYAQAFKDSEFTADSATYEQAMTAYYTAYQQYSNESSSASSKWNAYANKLYANANISIYGLYA